MICVCVIKIPNNKSPSRQYQQAVQCLRPSRVRATHSSNLKNVLRFFLLIYLSYSLPTQTTSWDIFQTIPTLSHFFKHSSKDTSSWQLMSKMTKGKLTLASRREEGGIQSRKKGRMSSIGTCFRGGLMSICTLSYFLKFPQETIFWVMMGHESYRRHTAMCWS